MIDFRRHLKRRTSVREDDKDAYLVKRRKKETELTILTRKQLGLQAENIDLRTQLNDIRAGMEHRMQEAQAAFETHLTVSLACYITQNLH